MTEKELKRLSRAELLELLLLRTRETELLTERLEAAERQLADREIKLEQAGDIAQAALEINGVMEAAQAAARQYLENIQRMERNTRERCEQMEKETRERCERLRREARAEAAQNGSKTKKHPGKPRRNRR